MNRSVFGIPGFRLAGKKLVAIRNASVLAANSPTPSQRLALSLHRDLTRAGLVDFEFGSLFVRRDEGGATGR